VGGGDGGRLPICMSGRIYVEKLRRSVMCPSSIFLGKVLYSALHKGLSKLLLTKKHSSVKNSLKSGAKMLDYL
jgi:hypothetical protein